MNTFQDADIEQIMGEDCNLNGGLALAIPTGLRQALCSFIVGALIKILEDEGESYSFLCHVSHKQNDHSKLLSNK